MHFSVMQLALILAIIVLLFGTRKLGNVGSDVGSAIRNFRLSLKRGKRNQAMKLIPTGKLLKVS